MRPLTLPENCFMLALFASSGLLAWWCVQQGVEKLSNANVIHR